jgi:uncharacterized repeat protein (TIGR03833 family)
MNGNNRKDIKPGLRVNITQKQDQRTGKLTSGVVKDILTKSGFPQFWSKKQRSAASICIY